MAHFALGRRVSCQKPRATKWRPSYNNFVNNAPSASVWGLEAVGCGLGDEYVWGGGVDEVGGGVGQALVAVPRILHRCCTRI